MNLDKLFSMQKELGKVGLFNYQGEDRFEKLILALLVELGECANCWRGFKFWSTNQEPKTKELRNAAMMEEDKEYYNPLLEEFVDGLHFVLELGIYLGHEKPVVVRYQEKSITKQFLKLNAFINELAIEKNFIDYSGLMSLYLTLGNMLGFTQEQIEQAYCEKHAINIQRQASGY